MEAEKARGNTERKEKKSQSLQPRLGDEEADGLVERYFAYQ